MHSADDGISHIMKKNKSLMRSAAAAPHILWAALFIVVPLLIVIYYAFTSPEGGFSMENIFGLTEYFDIFLGRMQMCRHAAEILGARFKLTANGSKVL